MVKRRCATLTLTLLATAVGLMTACAGDDGANGPGPVSQSETTSTSSPVPSSSAPWQALHGELRRCGQQPAIVQGAKFHTATLNDPQIGTTPAARLGNAETVLVLLHQTDDGGLCGWLRFMPAAAAAGYTTLAIDLCEYGEAQCRKVDRGTFTDAEQIDPVVMAVRYAHEELRAKHVVVMGASMGGSVALMSGTAIRGLTAVVDLSGPLEWRGSQVVRGGRALKVPTLVAMADSEGADVVNGARRLVQQAPRGSTFLAAQRGHGRELVTDTEGVETPLAADIFAWLATQTG